MFKRQILLILSTKSHFQTLLGRRNEFRRERRQEIQGLRCLNSLIAQKIQECSFLSKNMGINMLNLGLTIRFASSTSINSSDETLGWESSRLNPIHLIKDGAPDFSTSCVKKKRHVKLAV